MPVAPRIVNDVLYVTGISDACHFAWQAHYLDLFGEVGGWVLLLCAL